MSLCDKINITCCGKNDDESMSDVDKVSSGPKFNCLVGQFCHFKFYCHSELQNIFFPGRYNPSSSGATGRHKILGKFDCTE